MKKKPQNSHHRGGALSLRRKIDAILAGRKK